MKSQASKREQEQPKNGAKSKRLKHAVLSEDWGRGPNNKAAHHTTASSTTLGASSGGATQREAILTPVGPPSPTLTSTRKVTVYHIS